MTVRWSVAVASVGVLALIVGLAVMDRYHVGVFHDDAMYVILAKSLATGQGYRFLNLPGAPAGTSVNRDPIGMMYIAATSFGVPFGNS